MFEKNDPTDNQTLNCIENYLRSVNLGDEVTIRNTHGGILMFQLASITKKVQHTGRLYTDKSGSYGGNSWYMKTGMNCKYPTGKARIFFPSKEVRAFIEEYPRGILSYKIHFPQ